MTLVAPFLSVLCVILLATFKPVLSQDHPLYMNEIIHHRNITHACTSQRFVNKHKMFIDRPLVGVYIEKMTIHVIESNIIANTDTVVFFIKSHILHKRCIFPAIQIKLNNLSYLTPR